MTKQSLNVVSNTIMARTVSADDPRIVLPSGKRTDEMDTEALRKALLELPVPIAEGISMTEGRMSLLAKLQRHIAARRIINWDKPND